jgi:Flp pilus assembly protein TadG
MTENGQGRTTWGRRRESGHAVVEVALLAPWIFLLFIGVFDFGFYAYAAIATENAARVAALQTSSGTAVADDATLACTYVLEELRHMPNIKNSVTNCNSSPLVVTAQLIDPGVDGAPASRVTVTYQTIPLFPIPGMMMGQFNLTRIVEMRVKDD